MSNAKTLTLHMHSISPLHIADAGSGASHIDSSGFIRQGKVPGTMPVTRIERKPILIPKEVSGRDSDSVSHFPYIKANNMVGRLRRFAQDAINEVIVERGEQISDKTYRGLSCGATSGSPNGVEPTLSEHRAARKHFYLGLFGGGNGMFASGMSFGDFNIKHKHLISSGVLPQDLEGTTDVDINRLTYPISLVRRDRMTELTDFNIEKVISGGNEAVEAWRDLIAAASKKAEEIKEAKAAGTEDKAKAGARQMLRNLVAYEAALAGLGYYSKVTLAKQTNDAHVGLLLEALSRFAEANAMGGKSAKGFGRFNLTVKEGDNVLLQSVDGEIVKADGGRYTEALIDELDSLDIAELESFFA